MIARNIVVATAQGLWFGVRWMFTNIIHPLVRWAYRSVDRLLSRHVQEPVARHTVMAAAACFCLIAGVVVLQSLSDETPKTTSSDQNAKAPLALSTAPSTAFATTPTQPTANNPPRVPDPEVVRPATAASTAPAINPHAAAIVDELTASTSRAYDEHGYAGYRFGMTRVEVEAITKTELKKSWDPGWLTSDGYGRQQFVFDGRGRLAVVKKGYIGNNELYLGKITELFGKPSRSQVTQFSSPRSEGYIWHFWFPSCFAAVEVRADQDQILLVQVIDRQWATARLCEHLSRQRPVCLWLADLLHAIDAGRVTPANLPEYPRGKTVKSTDTSTRIFMPHPEGETPLLEYVLLVDRPPGQVIRRSELVVRFYAVATDEDALMLTTRLEPVAIKATSILAQEFFPPAGETIRVLTSKDIGSKSYEWVTASGWKVTINDDNTLKLAKVAGGEL